MHSLPWLIFSRNGLWNGSCGHTDRAGDDLNILRTGIYISLFECICGVAFLGGDKGCCHLNTVSTQFQYMADLVFIHNSASYDDWNGRLIFICIFFCTDDNAADFFIILAVVIRLIEMGELLFGKTEMSSGMSTFNDEKICGTVKTFIPAFQNNAGSFLRGDDGRDLCIGAFHICRHIHRKSGTGDDDICTCVGGGSHIIFIIAGGDHNVESHQSRTFAIYISCNGSCLF